MRRIRLSRLERAHERPGLGGLPDLWASGLARQFADILPAIRERFEVSYLLVEQNIDFAFSVIDRGYVLERGRIAVKGSTEELRDHPLILGYLAI